MGITQCLPLKGYAYFDIQCKKYRDFVVLNLYTLIHYLSF